MPNAYMGSRDWTNTEEKFTWVTKKIYLAQQAANRQRLGEYVGEYFCGCPVPKLFKASAVNYCWRLE